jgi:hypothetical protein
MSELLIQDSGVHAKAEFDVQIATAKMYPRKQHDEFIAKAISMVCFDQDTAQSCGYSIPARKGSNDKIEGPSIRLAEIAASMWGNLHAATRIIGNDGKFVTAQAVCWDLETNVKMGAEVKRSIMTSAKNGKTAQTYSTDMQVVTGNAACSIALRNAIIKTIPRAFINRIYDAAMNFATGDLNLPADNKNSFTSKRKEVFDKVKKMDIAPDTILSFFGKSSIEEITKDELRQIIGIVTSVHDGIVTKSKAFTHSENIDNFVSVDEHIINNAKDSTEKPLSGEVSM